MTEQPFAIPSLLLFLLAIPLAAGIVPRNRFYGLRTPRTLSEDRIWYPVNRVAGIALLIASGIYGAVALFRTYDPHAGDSLATWGIHLAAFVAPLIIGIGSALRYAKRF